MKSTTAILAMTAATMTMASVMQFPPMLSDHTPSYPAKRSLQTNAVMPHHVSDLSPRDTALSPAEDTDPLAAPSPKDDILSYLSYLYGVVEVGSAANQSVLQARCEASAAAVDRKWERAGLNTSATRTAVCDAANAMPNSTYGIVNSIVTRSKIFATQLVNSVNGTEQLSYLCQSLRLDLIDSFPLVGETVKDAVCEAAGTQRAPKSFSDRLKPNPSAIQAARNTDSILHAILTAISAMSSSELNLICSVGPVWADKLTALGLNGTLAASTVCKFKTPVPAPVGQEMIQSWMTRYFITVLENVSNVSNWKKWLCSNLDTEKMETVGLHGEGVQQQVCGDKKVASKLLDVDVDEVDVEF